MLPHKTSEKLIIRQNLHYDVLLVLFTHKMTKKFKYFLNVNAVLSAILLAHAHAY